MYRNILFPLISKFRLNIQRIFFNADDTAILICINSLAVCLLVKTFHQSLYRFLFGSIFKNCYHNLTLVTKVKKYSGVAGTTSPIYPGLLYLTSKALLYVTYGEYCNIMYIWCYKSSSWFKALICCGVWGLTLYQLVLIMIFPKFADKSQVLFANSANQDLQKIEKKYLSHILVVCTPGSSSAYIRMVFRYKSSTVKCLWWGWSSEYADLAGL